ncbi:hypothetical protein Vretifemale_5992 [Volvox reticuliferus]|uniref:GTP cyclohydrolase II domain-containing protein n=2 Tax=Volvox reticuliferus TaxID=1737510 RepID=A0A8J4FIE5_9CHLO|nr:hypothetical protein Vretifemale_5992 [Volvox reticuliferus]
MQQGHRNQGGGRTAAVAGGGEHSTFSPDYRAGDQSFSWPLLTSEDPRYIRYTTALAFRVFSPPFPYPQQEQGHDCREYTSVRNMLRELNVKSIRLIIPNNPRKINVLTKLGIEVTGRIPRLVAAGKYNQGYLEAKRDRMAHMLAGSDESDEREDSSGSSASMSRGGADDMYDDEEPNNGEFCFWDHSGEPMQAVSTAYAKDGMDLPEGLAHGEDGRVVPAMATATAGSGKDDGKAASV